MPYKLIDTFNRHINYVRISVTDRCDFRCIYCMNENMKFLTRKQVLTLEELELIGRAFVELGVTKIRLTGGEPLVRNNILQLFKNIGQLEGLKELVVTTNGSQLAKMAQSLKDAGVKRVNISLDTLKPERFQQITRIGKLDTVLRGIEAAVKVGFKRVKLNAVILKNRNHDEVTDLVQFAIQQDVDITFIEEMPMGVIDTHNRVEVYYSSDQIRHDLEQTFTLLPTLETTGGPSKYYRIVGADTRVGFISPHSHHFCATCNRVRVTTEGQLLLCLGQEHSVNLRQVLHAYPNDIDKLKQTIINAMALKPEGHEFNTVGHTQILRYMNATGG